MASCLLSLERPDSFSPGPNPAGPIVLLLTDAHAEPLALPRVVDLVEERDRSVVRALAGAERRRLVGRRYPELV